MVRVVSVAAVCLALAVGNFTAFAGEVFRAEYPIGEQEPSKIVPFTLKKGDHVTITAEGKVEHGHPFIGPSGPEGAGGPAPGEFAFPAPELQKFSLIANYNGGAWVLVGRSSSKDWLADKPGTLTLGYNDDQPRNRPRSVWTVTVVITRPD